MHRYDPADRLVQRESYRADGTLEQTDTFAWDDADNLTGWTTDRARGVLTFDDADRLLSETVTIDGVTKTITTTCKTYIFAGGASSAMSF